MQHQLYNFTVLTTNKHYQQCKRNMNIVNKQYNSVKLSMKIYIYIFKGRLRTVTTIPVQALVPEARHLLARRSMTPL